MPVIEEVAEEDDVSEDLGVLVSRPCCLDKAMTCMMRGWFVALSAPGMLAPLFSVMDSHLARVLALFGDTGGGTGGLGGITTLTPVGALAGLAGCGTVALYNVDGALSSSVVSSPRSESSLLPSSLCRLALRISKDFCFHSETSWCERIGSTGTGTVTSRLAGSSGPAAVARGKVLLNVTIVSLPIGLRGARSSTSTLARFRLPNDAFSRWMGRFKPSKEDGDVISSLLSEAWPLL